MELSCGFGLVAGPVIGSLLYEAGGYTAPFIFFAVILAICGVFMKKILPKEIDFQNQNSS